MRVAESWRVRAAAIDWLGWPAAVAVALLAALLRLRGIDGFSLTLDEATIVEFARGVLARGYPYVMVGSMEVPLATYELLPYPIALSMLLFGFSDFAVRLPAVLFGTATTLLVHASAARWFDRRSALLAALLYALSPWAIHWGHNAFHPAQAQFFAFLTVIRAHPLLLGRVVRMRDYYLTALCFVLAFLSWEGIGFLLPVLFATGIVLNGSRWQWLWRGHLWAAMGLIAAVVVLQGLRRVLLQASYLMVGSGKSEVSLPQLAFTHLDYDPWFYVQQFFGMESHVVLSAVFVCALPWLRHSPALRYVYAVLLGAVFFLTNFLSFSSAHYLYWVFPLFVIAVAATTAFIGERLLAGAPGPAARAAGMASLVLLLALELGSASAYGLRLYRLPVSVDSDRNDYRLGLAGVDYRGPLETFRRDYRPGDVVITLAGMPMDLYAGTSGDYFLQSVTGQKVIYDPGAGLPRYVDKYVGNPVLRSRAELEDLLYRHRRVWLFVAPAGMFTKLQDAELIAFVKQRLKPVAESYDSALYLWSR